MKTRRKPFVSAAVTLAAVVLLFPGGARAMDEAPVRKWGRELFIGHCAPCHGTDGGGHGTAAALRTAPPDLRDIRKNNQGLFPTVWVRRFIDGRSPVIARGPREMPGWGHVFGVERGSARARAEIHAITSYIESIQRD